MGHLVVFDLETTGLDKSKDFIIQFAAIKVDSETLEVIDTINQLIQPSGSYSIALGALYKHHITPDMLKDQPLFVDFAPKIVAFMIGCDILTYNGLSFDVPFLKNELERAGFNSNVLDFTKIKCYDAFLEEKRRNGNRLEETYARYKGKTMEEAGLTAHNALSDVKATLSIFVAQQRIKRYDAEKIYGEDNVITDMDFEGEIKPCFNIGKYRGVSIEQIAKVDLGYLKWTQLDKCGFSESTKKFIAQYINE